MSRFKNHNHGFTAIELLVSVGIFLVFAALSLTSYPTFGNRASLDLLVHDIALTAREAQVYALGVRRVGGVALPSYGVHFDTSNPKNFILFTDNNPVNGKYDAASGCGSAGTECVQSFSITGKETIKDLCAQTGGRAYTELSAGEKVSLCGKGALDFVFVRPRPDAKMCVRGTLASPCDVGTIADAEVVVESPTGETRTALVFISGQIAVK